MKCIAPVIPVWADKIEVEPRRGDRIRVRGFDRSSYALIPQKSAAAISGLNRNRKKPMHLEFANACSLDQLVDFVRKHGPIQGKVESKRRHKNKHIENAALEDLVVRQDLNELVREQRLFHAAVLLLRELRAGRQNRLRIGKLVSQIRQFYPAETAKDRRSKATAAFLALGLIMAEPTLLKRPKDAVWKQRTIERVRYDSILLGTKTTKEGVERRETKEDILRHHAVEGGHGVLCNLFNRFPLKMFPCSMGAIELPSYDREGILPILYFLLRRDYRDRHYSIKVCKVCGETFKPERGDSDCCNRRCYKRYNDRDRYLKKKKLLKAA